MRIIDKIHIKWFRSLYDARITAIKHLNVFSGINDCGKSNILKALNLFFNEKTDFNKTLHFANDYNTKRRDEVRKDTIRGKQFIQIRIEFDNDGQRFYKNLPDKFAVMKGWDRLGTLMYQKDDIENRFKSRRQKYSVKSVKQSLSLLLNSIKFEYIPAIKSNEIFEYLLSILLDVISIEKGRTKEGSRSFTSSINEFNLSISEATNILRTEFANITGIESDLNLPKDLRDLFKSILINTKLGDHHLPLSHRGDGIKMRYIPTILNYITKLSNKRYIWGFEEPENSFEYGNAERLAKDFEDVYSKNAQIFLTTHSFAFISLKGVETSAFRVYKETNSTKVKLISTFLHNDLFEVSDDLKLTQELGIVSLQRELHKRYIEEIENVKKIYDKNRILEIKLTQITKPILLTEGITDSIILSIAWQKLNSSDCPVEIKDCDTIGDGGGAGVDMITNFLNSFPKYFLRKVIGLFDRDEAGIKGYERLNRNFIPFKNSSDIKYNPNSKAFAILLPVPNEREKFAEVKNLPIEYYFSKIALEKSGLKFEPRIIITKDNKGNELGQTKATEDHLLEIKGDKKTFAEKIVPVLNPEEFYSFKILFKIILDILNN